MTGISVLILVENSMVRNTRTLLRWHRRQRGGGRIGQGPPQTPSLKQQHRFFQVRPTSSRTRHRADKLQWKEPSEN